jgi:hypothetical protein
MYVVSKAGSKAPRKRRSKKWILNNWATSCEKSEGLIAGQYKHTILEGKISEGAGNTS